MILQNIEEWQQILTVVFRTIVQGVPKKRSFAFDRPWRAPGVD